jgi:hypothetical protein
VLPAGTACEFTLIIDTVGINPVKQFTDKNGLLVRTIEAGRGNQLTFSTDINDSVYVIKPNGSVNQTTFGPQGGQNPPSTVQLSGHNVLILFPSDIPAGPTTIQYIGHVEYTVDAQGVFTVTKTTGRQVDICAALSN